MSVAVLVVDVAAGPQQCLADPGVAVELGGVEERGLAEEVIVVEGEVEGEKVPHDLFLLVPAGEVQDGLLVEVLVPDVSALLHQIVQRLQAGLLVADLDGPEEHILPLKVETLDELSRPGVADDGPADVVSPVLVDHLPEQKHHLLRLTHFTYKHTYHFAHSSRLQELFVELPAQQLHLLVGQRNQLQHLFLVLAREGLLYGVFDLALAQEEAVDLVGLHLAQDAGSQGQVVVLADHHLRQHLELAVFAEAARVLFGDWVLLRL